ncbi:MAG: hypothetical protein KAG95_04485 [Bacteroidales bacterium]|nr:hypothetical protein [Bacteroidales bacterium]
MNINRNNYEVYFIDYFDGILNSEQEEQLFVFLSHNSDLKYEFDNFENVSLCVDKVAFRDKQILKKDLISKEDFNEYCIDKIEGNFSHEKEIFFKNYLKENQDNQKEYNLFKKSVLLPDLSVRFDQKQELKKIDFGSNFDKASVACLEKDLSISEKERFKIFLTQNPQKKKEYQQFEKTIINNDKSIVFEDKMLLKKHFVTKTNKIKAIFSYVSAAAAIVLLFFGFSYYQNLLETETVAMSKIDSSEVRVSFSNSAGFINSQENRKKNFASKDYGSKQYNKMVKQQAVKKRREKIKPIKARREVRFANNYDNSIVATPKSYKIIKTHPQKYNTISHTVVQKITEKVIKPETVSSGINLWDIAKAGIRTINNLTGSKIELEKQISKNGTGETLAVNSRNFDFSTKIKKNK